MGLSAGMESFLRSARPLVDYHWLFVWDANQIDKIWATRYAKGTKYE